MTLRIPVILGTVREGNRTSAVARYVHARLASREGIESAFIDPAELPLGNLVAREWEMPEKPRALVDLVRTIDEADGFVIVSPEYNHGMPGALKNLIDFIYDEWNDKPFAICSTGGVSGGMRMTEQLRLVILALKAHPIHAALHVPFVAKAFDENGEATDPKLAQRVERLLDSIVRAAVQYRPMRAARAEEARVA